MTRAIAIFPARLKRPLQSYIAHSRNFLRFVSACATEGELQLLSKRKCKMTFEDVSNFARVRLLSIHFSSGVWRIYRGFARRTLDARMKLNYFSWRGIISSDLNFKCERLEPSARAKGSLSLSLGSRAHIILRHPPPDYLH